MTPDPKPKTPRDKKHLAHVRTFPCVFDGPACFGDIVAHHYGKRGIGIKASDYDTIPVCQGHHLRLHNGTLTLASVDIEAVKAKINEGVRNV